jgi:hypothetical protein
MVKLVDGDQPVVERLDAQFLDREAEGGMGADQHLVVAGQELATAFDLGPCHAGLSMPGALHRFHCGATCQSAQKPNCSGLRRRSWRRWTAPAPR